MKSVFVAVLAAATFAGVSTCSKYDFICHLTGYKVLNLSDMRQMKCVKESSSPDPEVFQLAFEEDGTRWNCAEIRSSDSDFNSTAEYPAVPVEADKENAFSYAHIGASGQIVNCFPSQGEVDEIIYTASKGYFLVVNVKNDKRYLCIHANKQHESLGDRLAKAFSADKNCEEILKEV